MSRRPGGNSSSSPAISATMTGLRIAMAAPHDPTEGPIAMVTCADEEKNDCALDQHCRVKPHLVAVNGAFRGALQGVSLASLAEVK